MSEQIKNTVTVVKNVPLKILFFIVSSFSYFVAYSAYGGNKVARFA